MPRNIGKKYEDFWGGYKIEFKVVSDKLFFENVNNIDRLRKVSTVVGPNQKKVFTIDISKFEYCTDKEAIEIDGYVVPPC